MSGWIRVKELPTRYEVRSENANAYSAYWRRKEAVFELAEARRNEGFDEKYKLVTIRRHQVKRTEVVEEHYEHFTSWTTSPGVIIEAILRRNGWCVRPHNSIAEDAHATREEAETAARKWLDTNGYRIRKVAT